MTSEKRSPHQDRKPICDCDNPEPTTLGEGTLVEYEMCQKCKGVIQEEASQ